MPTADLTDKELNVLDLWASGRRSGATGQNVIDPRWVGEAVAEIRRHREDLDAAQRELMVSIDEMPPGSTTRRLMIANSIMRRERDEARAASALTPEQRTSLANARDVLADEDPCLSDLAAAREAALAALDTVLSGGVVPEAQPKAWVDDSDPQAAMREVMGDAPTPAVCTYCSDTHRVAVEGAWRACNHCPVPCQSCRDGGNGPYCTATPCSCSCHRKPTSPWEAYRV